MAAVDDTLDEGSNLEQVIQVELGFASKQAYGGSTYSGNNHDSGGVFTIADDEGRVKYAITFVADGLSHGGYGEIASNIAKEIFEGVVKGSLADLYGHASELSTTQIEEIALQAIDFANEVIFNTRGHLVDKKFLYDPNFNYFGDVPLTNREGSRFQADKSWANEVVKAVADRWGYTSSETIWLGKDRASKPSDKDKVLATTFTANIVKLDHEAGTYNHTVVNVGDSRSFIGREGQQEQQVTQDMVLGAYVPEPGVEGASVFSGLGFKSQLRDVPVHTFNPGEYGLTDEKRVQRFSIQTFEGNVLENGQSLTIYSASDGAYKFAHKEANGNMLVRESNSRNLQALVNFAVESTHDDLTGMPISGVKATTFSGEGSPDDATIAAVRLTLEQRTAASDDLYQDGDLVGYRIVVRNTRAQETVHDKRYDISDFVIENPFINKAGLSIGRRTGNSIVINNPGLISRKHGRFYIDEGNKVMYEDLNSQNGSFFNRGTSFDKITGSVVVPEGAIVSLAMQYDVELIPLIKSGNTRVERPYNHDTTAQSEDKNAAVSAPSGPTRNLRGDRAVQAEPEVAAEQEVAVEAPAMPPPLPDHTRNDRRQIGDLEALAERRQVRSQDGLVLDLPPAYAAKQEEDQRTTRLQVEPDPQDARTVMTHYDPGQGHPAVDLRRPDQKLSRPGTEVGLGDISTVYVAPDVVEDLTATRADIRVADLIPAVHSDDGREIARGEGWFSEPAAAPEPDTSDILGTSDIYDQATYANASVGKDDKEPFYQKHPIATTVVASALTIGVIAYGILSRDNTLADRLKEAAAKLTPELRESEVESARERSGLETVTASYAVQPQVPEPQPQVVDPYAAETLDKVSLTPVRVGDRLFYLASSEQEGLTVSDMAAKYNTAKSDVCKPVQPADFRVVDKNGQASHLVPAEGKDIDSSKVNQGQRYLAECIVK